MRITKTMAISGTIVAAGLTGLMGAHAANAASDPQNGQQGLVDKIASTFNLNKSDVQQVFTEEHQAQEAAHQQAYGVRVNQAVKDGKLTQDLADQLIAKQKEIMTYRDSLKDSSLADRKGAMKTEMDDFVKWAQSNNIPQDLWPMGPRMSMQMPMNGSN